MRKEWELGEKRGWELREKGWELEEKGVGSWRERG